MKGGLNRSIQETSAFPTLNENSSPNQQELQQDKNEQSLEKECTRNSIEKFHSLTEQVDPF